CAAAVSVCFNDTATTEIYTLSLHDALPISHTHTHTHTHTLFCHTHAHIFTHTDIHISTLLWPAVSCKTLPMLKHCFYVFLAFVLFVYFSFIYLKSKYFMLWFQ